MYFCANPRLSRKGGACAQRILLAPWLRFFFSHLEWRRGEVRRREEAASAGLGEGERRLNGVFEVDRRCCGSRIFFDDVTAAGLFVRGHFVIPERRVLK